MQYVYENKKWKANVTIECIWRMKNKETKGIYKIFWYKLKWDWGRKKRKGLFLPYKDAVEISVVFFKLLFIAVCFRLSHYKNLPVEISTANTPSI